MRSGIHPEYIETAVECGCGNKFTTRSTVPKIQVEICSACHPFYTGKQKFVDTAGRVEKFQKRFDWKDSSSSTVLSATEAKRVEERERIAATEAAQRDEITKRKKANDERRVKLLDRKRKEYERKAAEAAAQEATAQAAAPAEAAPSDAPAPAEPAAAAAPDASENKG